MQKCKEIVRQKNLLGSAKLLGINIQYIWGGLQNVIRTLKVDINIQQKYIKQSGRESKD